jgi:hypothetical protein
VKPPISIIHRTENRSKLSRKRCVSITHKNVCKNPLCWKINIQVVMDTVNTTAEARTASIGVLRDLCQNSNAVQPVSALQIVQSSPIVAKHVTARATSLTEATQNGFKETTQKASQNANVKGITANQTQSQTQNQAPANTAKACGALGSIAVNATQSTSDDVLTALQGRNKYLVVARLFDLKEIQLTDTPAVVLNVPHVVVNYNAITNDIANINHMELIEYRTDRF